MWNSIDRSILVPYDLDDPFPDVLEAAASFASSRDSVRALYVVARLPPHATSADQLNRKAKEGLSDTQEKLVAALDEAGYPEYVPHVAFGEPGPTIVEVIERTKPNLVIMPSHGRRGIKRLVLGSVAEYVVRRAGVPVLVLPRTDFAG